MESRVTSIGMSEIVEHCSLLQKKYDALMANLQYEKSLRMESERKLLDVEKKLRLFQEDVALKYKKKISVEERNQARKEKVERYKRGKTAQGKSLPKPSDSILSYDEFALIRKYLLNSSKLNGKRNCLLWSLGCTFGIRISDLAEMCWNDLFYNDWSFRERTMCIQRKTGKLNKYLITDAAKKFVNDYLGTLNETPNLEDKIFRSRKQNSENPQAFYNSMSKIIKDAAIACGIERQITSHGMRKSFSRIVECCYDGTMTESTMTTLQMLLNHSDSRITQRYMGEGQRKLDEARKSVSDFLLGKSINKLEKPKEVTNKDLKY